MAQANPETLTKLLADLPNHEIATLALASLGGTAKRIHTEEIAERAMELAPEKFAWRMEKYRDRGWPQIFVVKNALEDAQKESKGTLVRGSCTTDLSKDGWSLTPQGAAWAKTRLHMLKNEGSKDTWVLTADRQRMERQMKKVKKTSVFRLFVKDGTLENSDIFAFADMLNTSADSSKDVISRKFNTLASQANMVGSEVLIRFFEECENRYADFLINKKDGEGKIG